MSLLNRVRSLRQEYDAALRNFVGLGKWAHALDMIGDLEGLPQEFLGEWEGTTQYGGFVTRFDSLFDECSSALGEIVGSQGRAIAIRLHSVTEAVQLETKLRRLIQCLEGASTENLRYKSETRPKRGVPSRSRRPQVPPSNREELAVGVLAVIIAVVALCLGLFIPTLGVQEGGEVGAITAALGIAVLWVTQRWWVPGLVRAFSRSRR